MSRKVSERDLASIGIGREEVRVLGLLPLVVVAWADGKLQHTEKARILA